MSHHSNSLVRNHDGTLTETITFDLGRLERKEFESAVRAFCKEWQLPCEVSEDPHIFSVEATFTITGSEEALVQLRRYASELMAQADSLAREMSPTSPASLPSFGAPEPPIIPETKAP